MIQNGMQNKIFLVGFEVLIAGSMKLSAFWTVALCDVVDVYRDFRGTLHVMTYSMASIGWVGIK